MSLAFELNRAISFLLNFFFCFCFFGVGRARDSNVALVVLTRVGCPTGSKGLEQGCGLG